MLRLIGALILLLVAAIQLARAETVGFAQAATISDWRQAFTTDMREEASRRGITLRLDIARPGIEHQIEAVRGFVAQHVDAIVINPIAGMGWTPVLKEAQAAGIPVFIAHGAVDADPSLFVARIAADFNLEGRLAGAWLAQASRGRCGIVELHGLEHATSTVQREKGFQALIAQFPAMRIMATSVGDFTAEGGARAMRELIAATDGLRNVCAVWAHNDDMLLGAIPVMKQAGARPGRNVLTISVDSVSDMLHAIIAGDANAAVELRSDIGKEILDVVQSYLAGARSFPKWVLLPSDLHTIEDAASVLRRRSGS